MTLLRILRERWAWWLVPMLLTLAVVAYLALTRPEPEPTMPMHYDLPGEP